MTLRDRLFTTADPLAGSRILAERLGGEAANREARTANSRRGTLHPAPSERRVCIAEVGNGEWLALVVDETPDGVTAAAGEDPVSAFAALVVKLPWLSTGEAA